MKNKIFPYIVLTISVLTFCGFYTAKIADIETAIIEKKYAVAQQLAQELIDSRPNDAEADEAKYYLGLSLLYLNRHIQARQIFDELASHVSDEKLKDKVLIGIINSFYMAGDYQGALSQAQALSKQRKDSESLSLIYLKIARANLRLAKWKEAHTYLDEIVKNFPDSLEFHTAKQLLEEKQFYAVQVGAFLDSRRANALAEQLKNQNEYAYIIETVDKTGAKFYRVRVGKLTRLEDAEKLDQKLSQVGYPTRIYP